MMELRILVSARIRPHAVGNRRVDRQSRLEILNRFLATLSPEHCLTADDWEDIGRIVEAAPPMTNADAVRICRVLETSEYFRNLP